MPNFSFLAGLEVPEQFVVVVGWGGGTLGYCDLNASCLEFGLTEDLYTVSFSLLCPNAPPGSRGSSDRDEEY